MSELCVPPPSRLRGVIRTMGPIAGLRRLAVGVALGGYELGDNIMNGAIEAAETSNDGTALANAHIMSLSRAVNYAINSLSW